MEKKLAILLVPLFLLGQIHSVKFSIEKFSEDDHMGVLISYGEINQDSDVKKITLENSKYACLKSNNGAKITFPMPKERSSDFKLFINEDSSKFEVLEKFNEDIEWEDDDDVCFLLGSWWPSENNTKDNFELYLSFLGSLRQIEERKVIYLTAALKNGFINSSLYINKESNSQVDSDALKVAQDETKEQTIVGKVKCEITQDSPFFMYLGVNEFSRQGDGELKMVSIINKIKREEEELAAKILAENSSTEVADTPWAYLECGKNWIKFRSKYQFPNHEAEQDDHEYQAEDEGGQEGFVEYDEKYFDFDDEKKSENDFDLQNVIDFYKNDAGNNQGSEYKGYLDEDNMLDEESDAQLFTGLVDNKNKII